jgi:hypothetical protein
MASQTRSPTTRRATPSPRRGSAESTAAKSCHAFCSVRRGKGEHQHPGREASPTRADRWAARPPDDQDPASWQGALAALQEAQRVLVAPVVDDVRDMRRRPGAVSRSCRPPRAPGAPPELAQQRRGAGTRGAGRRGRPSSTGWREDRGQQKSPPAPDVGQAGDARSRRPGDGRRPMPLSAVIASSKTADSSRCLAHQSKILAKAMLKPARRCARGRSRPRLSGGRVADETGVTAQEPAQRRSWPTGVSAKRRCSRSSSTPTLASAHQAIDRVAVAQS